MAALKIRMAEVGICTEMEWTIDRKATENEFLELAKNIFDPNRKAKVFICFCQGETVLGLLQAMDTLKLHGKGYVLIGR